MSTRTATQKQVNFIHSLLDQVAPSVRSMAKADLEINHTSEYAIRNDRRDLFGDRLSMDRASAYIERLLQRKAEWESTLEQDRKDQQADRRCSVCGDPMDLGEPCYRCNDRANAEPKTDDRRFLQTADYPDLPAGRYAVTGEDGTTDFYRVDHGKNNWKGVLFIKLQISDDERNLRGSTAAAIAAKITADGPAAASIRYGKEIGSCGVCGRTLTNNDSIAAGIGPVCAEKMGW